MGWVTRTPLQVTEFVPKVVAADYLLVGCAHDVGRQKSIEQVRMTGLRLMQSGEHAVNNPEFVGSRDGQLLPAVSAFAVPSSEIFQEALGPEIAVERREHLLTGARRCAYRITRRVSSAGGARYI